MILMSRFQFILYQASLAFILRLSMIYFLLGDGNHMPNDIYKLFIGRSPWRTGDVWKFHRFFFPLCCRFSRRLQILGLSGEVFVSETFANN